MVPVRGDAPECVFERLPVLNGRVIRVFYRPSLTAWKGKLLSRSDAGTPVYAGSFLRQRRIVLDSCLKRTPHVLERIFIHELFHFVWPRLGTPLRSSWERLIAGEFRRKVPGELGWSSELAKQGLTSADRKKRTRRWKDYLCESFCDTAAWQFGGSRRYAENTLGREERALRRAWLKSHLLNRVLGV